MESTTQAEGLNSTPHLWNVAPPKRQREPGIEEAREGATGHTGEHAWTGNEGLQDGRQEGGQQSMRVEGDYEEDCEEEHEVNFVNQAGTLFLEAVFH